MSDERQWVPHGRMTEEESRNYNQTRVEREARLAVEESKADKAGSIIERLQKHLAQLAPHQRERYSNQLMVEALAVLKWLESKDHAQFNVAQVEAMLREANIIVLGGKCHCLSCDSLREQLEQAWW